MFRELRRKDKKLSDQEAVEILKSAEEGVLATIGEDDYPYAVPLNYAYFNDCIYFHCATSGHKIDNINHNPKVSFCVIRDTRIIPENFSTKFKSVVLFGTVQEAIDDEKREALMALVHKFSGNHVNAGEKYIETAIDKTRVFKINIERISGKGHADNPPGHRNR